VENANMMQMFGLFGQVVSSFLSRHFQTIVAVFVLWLAYRLLRIGLQKTASEGQPVEWRRYFALMAPGMAFAIFGIVFIMGRDPLSLVIYLLTMTTVIGFGFAFLGYRLFDKGVLGASDLEAVWNDRKLLLKRAAPGTLFAFFGVVMIATTLWVSPRILKDYNESERLGQQQLMSVVDARAKDALALVKQYLDQKSGVEPREHEKVEPQSR
jgi:hypothetical protein